MEAGLGPNPFLEKGFQRRYLQNQIAHIGEISVYRTDIICWYRDSLLVCMHETTPDYVTKIAGHLNELIFAHIGKNIMMGISTFPTDGLILEDLIAIASKNLNLFEKAKTGRLVSFVDEQKHPTA